jgi:hypothetical protein
LESLEAHANDLLWGSRAVAGQFVASFNGLYNIHAFDDFTEDSVVAIEPWSWDGSQEELGATGVAACVCHREYSWLVVLEAQS